MWTAPSTAKTCWQELLQWNYSTWPQEQKSNNIKLKIHSAASECGPDPRVNPKSPSFMFVWWRNCTMLERGTKKRWSNVWKQSSNLTQRAEALSRDSISSLLSDLKSEEFRMRISCSWYYSRSNWCGSTACICTLSVWVPTFMHYHHLHNIVMAKQNEAASGSFECYTYIPNFREKWKHTLCGRLYLQKRRFFFLWPTQVRLKHCTYAMWAGDIISTFMSAYRDFSLFLGHNRPLSVIRPCFVWEYPISAPVASSVVRLHHVSLTDTRAVFACGMEEGRQKIRHVYQVQRCLSDRWELDAALQLFNLSEKKRKRKLSFW